MPKQILIPMEEYQNDMKLSEDRGYIKGQDDTFQLVENLIDGKEKIRQTRPVEGSNPVIARTLDKLKQLLKSNG